MGLGERPAQTGHQASETGPLPHGHALAELGLTAACPFPNPRGVSLADFLNRTYGTCRVRPCRPTRVFSGRRGPGWDCQVGESRRTQFFHPVASEQNSLVLLQNPTRTAPPPGAFHGSFKYSVGPGTHHTSFSRNKSVPRKIPASLNNQEPCVSAHLAVCQKRRR